MLANGTARPKMHPSMARFRPLLALCSLLLSAGLLAGAPEPAGLTAAEVIAKARAAVAADPADLARVRTLRLAFTAVNLESRQASDFVLTLQAPNLRLLTSKDRDRQAESSVCAGRLEAWMSRKTDALSRRELKAVPYAEFKKMQDMASDDLAFYAAPADGTVTYRGTAEIEGRRAHVLDYAYRSGFAITRCFDAETFLLVASDQQQPGGPRQRQLVAATTKVAGLVLVSKEVIVLDGKKTAEVTYGRIEVNPTVDPHAFDFPPF
jgi:hypothetical protein